MKKFIAILISSSMMLAPIAFADQTKGTNSTDQVMQAMPGNDANAAGADQKKPVKKHHMKKHRAKKHKRHHRHHHRTKSTEMAPT